MKTDVPLPGLEHLMEVCGKLGFPFEPSPPDPSKPGAGAPFLGAPFDPQLAATYARLGGALLEDFVLYKPGPHEHGLARTNEGLRRKEERHFSLSFPWDVPELIARDEPLVRMMEAGRFDFLMKGDEHTRNWLARVRQAARTRGP